MADLFGSDSRQLGLGLDNPNSAKRPIEPDPDEIRAELTEVLAQAKAAQDAAPWDERTFKYHKVVFPQMARWLPDDEREQLCFEFFRELARIELLMAA
jgi:hypothetical protein